MGKKTEGFKAKNPLFFHKSGYETLKQACIIDDHIYDMV